MTGANSHPKPPQPGDTPELLLVRAQPETVTPELGLTAGATADELLAHGILTHLALDDEAAQRARVDRVMKEISAVQAPGRHVWVTARTLRAWGTGIAATLLAAFVFFGVPGQPTADAMVKASISALRSPGDRRYEVRIFERGKETQAMDEPTAVVDTRDGGLMLLRGKSRDGESLVVGRDEQGSWALRREDGGIERAGAMRAWPRWASLGEESLFADSVDRLLEGIEKTHTLAREDSATLEGHANGEKLRHVVGTRKPSRPFGPAKIDVWIDPRSNLVERLELSFDPADGNAGPRGPAGGGPGGPRGGRPDGPGPGGLGGPGFIGGPDGGPRDPEGRGPGRRGPGGPGGPDGPRPRRPGEDDDGGGRPPRDPSDNAAPEGPEGGRPMRPRDQGPDGPRPMGPEGQRPFGPGGPGGPGPKAGGPMGGGPGRPNPPPPARVVIDRVQTPTFEDGWFSPEKHVQAK